MKSLATFLSICINRSSRSGSPSSRSVLSQPTWFLESSFSTPSAYAAFQSSLTPTITRIISASTTSRAFGRQFKPSADTVEDFDEDLVGGFVLADLGSAVGTDFASWPLHELEVSGAGALAGSSGDSTGDGYISVITVSALNDNWSGRSPQYHSSNLT